MAALTHPLDDILSSRAKLRICRLLLSTEEPLSAREMGRRTGTVKRSVDLALIELTGLGVVRRDGTSVFSAYRINTKHVLVAGTLGALFAGEAAATGALFATLRSLVERVCDDPSQLLWGGIFGSMARGDDSPTSDLDLAVLVAQPDATMRVHEALVSAGAEISERFGRTLSPLVLSRDNFERMRSAKDPLVMTMIADGRRLAGAVRDLEAIGSGQE